MTTTTEKRRIDVNEVANVVTTVATRKPLTFMEVAAALFVLLLLALWIAVFHRVNRYL